MNEIKYSEWGSAANTIAIWRTRRISKGRECTREHVAARIKELWHELSDEQIAEVITVSEKPIGAR